MSILPSLCQIGIYFYLAATIEVSGQEQPVAQPTQQPVTIAPIETSGQSRNQIMFQTFVQEQRALAKERRGLELRGATPQQLEAWQQKNAARFAAQEQRADRIGRASALQQVRANRQPHIPVNASQTLRDFLATQATLRNARAQIHNQLLQALPAGATEVQVVQMEQQEVKEFLQLHATDLHLQAQRAVALADESSQQDSPEQSRRSSQTLSPATATTQN